MNGDDTHSVAKRADLLRRISALFAGLVAFAALASCASLVAKLVWPTYAAAEPTRAYTLDMMLVRQLAGMLSSLAAGAVAGSVGRGDKQTVLLTGVVMLLIAVVWHVWIWEQYPVWYHVLLFVYLVPLAVLGGRMTISKIDVSAIDSGGR